MSIYSKYRHSVVEKKNEKYFVSKIIEGFPRVLRARKMHPEVEYRYSDDLRPDDVEQSSLDIVDFERLIGVVLSSIYGRQGKVEDSSMFNCRTDFKAYQFRPLLKFYNNGYKRILIADEAGLGKTIEAGYILAEEMARKGLDRVLIVAPSNLKYKWRQELWNRFGLRFDIIRSGKQLESRIGSQDGFFGIASMDLVRNLEPDDTGLYFQDYGLDMVIIDEVHHMIGRGSETYRRKFGISVSTISDTCVGLTAVPVQIESDDLKNIFDVVFPGLLSQDEFDRLKDLNSTLNQVYWLLSKESLDESDFEEISDKSEDIKENVSRIEPDLSNTDGFEELYKKINGFLGSDDSLKKRLEIRDLIKNLNPFNSLYTRSRSDEVGESRERDIENICVELSDEEVRGYQGGEEVSISEKEIFNQLDFFLKESFSVNHRFQLSSCLPAMLGLLREGMKGFSVWNASENEFELDKHRLSEDERNESKSLADKFGLLKKDSKWDVLKGKLMEMEREDRKTIVFTQWIPTLNHFDRKRKQLGYETYLISSEDESQERRRKAKEFQREEGFSVLFSTDILSEGIDLQSASAVINYDLPTNPQIIEQRIGRVDRVGQERDTVKIVNLIVKGSKDEEWFPKIKSRIEKQRNSIGSVRRILEEDDRGFIDGDEAAIHFNREKDMERLKKNVLWGVDDVLDEEIREKHKQLKTLGDSLRWTCLRNMLIGISGEEGIEVEIDHNFRKAKILNLREFDLKVIKDILGKKHGFKTTNDLESTKSGGVIRLDLGSGDGEGLHIPYHHPLFKSAVSISNNVFLENLEPETDEELPLYSLSPVESKKPYEGDFLFMVEYKLAYLGDIERQYFWFALDLDMDSLIELPEFSIRELYRDFRDKRIETDLNKAVLKVDKESLKKRFKYELKDWMEEKIDYIEKTSLLEKRREKNFLTWRLEKIESNKEPDTSKKGIETLRKEIKNNKKEINEIKARKKPIETDVNFIVGFDL
ncbi:DEAD/DEAH box helicase [Methanonatronarchaeum sp. AMET6-2]|uniref:DEAD/DEAH box helicase n=1 Tax=Methanonatronarchaeum sp. AMET6-2 TaxID=2933293 RepID=UPI001FF55D9A|nr:helicase-related protein [Methanonatronarchaeum sp. AMET6-2]UOY10008.1 SNF2-related protein [Methanonatronarchaeum sp. AMET6-2]